MKKYIIFTFFIILSLFLFCGCSKKEKELNDLETIKKRGHIIVGVKTDSPPLDFIKIKNYLALILILQMKLLKIYLKAILWVWLNLLQLILKIEFLN